MGRRPRGPLTSWKLAPDLGRRFNPLLLFVWLILALLQIQLGTLVLGCSYPVPSVDSIRHVTSVTTGVFGRSVMRSESQRAVSEDAGLGWRRSTAETGETIPRRKEAVLTLSPSGGVFNGNSEFVSD